MASSVAEIRSVDASVLFNFATSALSEYQDLESARQYIIEQIDQLDRSRLRNLPQFLGFKRGSVSGLRLAQPLGRIWGFIGVPKIGKTSAVLQLIHSWAHFAVRLYDIPPDALDACSTEITRDILSALLPPNEVERALRAPAQLSEYLRSARAVSAPSVYIIDNADNLSASDRRRLNAVLGVLIRLEHVSNIALILIGTRKLTGLSVIQEYVSAPAWTAEELGVILTENGVSLDPSTRDDYLSLLEGMSGGHPLVAVALGRKWQSIVELLSAGFTSPPSLHEEMLSSEVQALLYDDLLADADAQNFVQRLALLTERATAEGMSRSLLNLRTE